MTEAVTARRNGDIFQARIFWLRAARLLFPDSPIQRVAFEKGPRAFDDIWVDFMPERGPQDQGGTPLIREHIQCKWHVSPGSYGFAELVDPEFVNANARSLLQRAHVAQLEISGDTPGVRFKLVTNWTVDRGDPLKDLIGMRSGALRANRLFDGSTDRSKAGKVRKLWREHLGIDDPALGQFAASLAFGQASDSLDDLREQLDLAFLAAGLRRIPLHESLFPYDELIFSWMAQGRQEFDRAGFADACRREGLLATSTPATITYGVKSFEHALDPLELRCLSVLDLTGEFDDRFIRDEADWNTTLYPRLRRYLIDVARHDERLRLALDAHATLAFAAGSVLDLKSGRAIELEQRSPQRQVWSLEDCEPDATWPALEAELVEIGEGSELAIAVAFTHDIAGAVAAYAACSLPNVGRVLVCRTAGGTGPRSIKAGRHAWDLVQQLVARIRATTTGGHAHLFLAAPNAVSFFVGQHRRMVGPTTLYEFDFEGERDATYRPSLSLPSQPSMM
jgi:hypothetical protein